VVSSGGNSEGSLSTPTALGPLEPAEAPAGIAAPTAADGNHDSSP
jgi:hypothetical protein